MTDLNDANPTTDLITEDQAKTEIPTFGVKKNTDGAAITEVKETEESSKTEVPDDISAFYNR